MPRVWRGHGVAVYGHIPVPLVTQQGSLWVIAGAIAAAALLTVGSVRLLHAPRAVWLGVPIGHVAVFAIVWAIALTQGVSVPVALPVFLASDVPAALLVTAAAYGAVRLFAPEVRLTSAST